MHRLIVVPIKALFTGQLASLGARRPPGLSDQGATPNHERAVAGRSAGSSQVRTGIAQSRRRLAPADHRPFAARR